MARYNYSSFGGAIRRTLLTDPEQPNKIVVQTQVDLPDLEANNRALGEMQKLAGGDMKLLARVPMTIWEQSHHENWDEDDWKRWLNDPDNAPFRVWKGRV